MAVIKPADIIKRNHPPMILIYGKGGCGKTALVSQAANGYVYDYDSGMRTAATLQDKFFDQRSRVSIFADDKGNNPLEDRGGRTKPVAHINFINDLLRVSDLCSKGKFPYNAVIVDSHTFMCQAIYRHIMYIAGKDKPEIQHWGMMVNEVENIMVILRSLPLLVIMTAHDMLCEETESEKSRMVTSITAKYSTKIPAMFDEVWYMVSQPLPQNKFKYTIYGKPYGIAMARTRTGINNVEISEIGLTGLLDKMGYILDVSAPKVTQ